MKIKSLFSVVVTCAIFLSSMSFTTFASDVATVESSYHIANTSLEIPKSRVIAETEEYTITWVSAVPRSATLYNSKYTISNWKPQAGSTAYGRVFTITANNTIYIDYDLNWTPSSNVSIGTYSQSSGFKTAITVSSSSADGALKVETKSKPVDLSFAIRNNGSKTITANGYYMI